MSKLESDKSPYIDVVKLSAQEQAGLLAELVRDGGDGRGVERRCEERIQYHKEAGLVVEMHHPGGAKVNYLVRARNLSSHGIGFLHGSRVETGSRCLVTLLTLDNRAVRVEGTVVRCQNIHRHIHDIGVRFDGPISMRDFVARALLVGRGTDSSAELPRLCGSVLYIEDSVSDQDLISFHLRNLGMRVRTVSNGLAAMDLAASTQFDMVITGASLPGFPGPSIAQSLREHAFRGPIIAMAADETEKTREEAIRRGCTCVLAKPYTFDELVRLITQHTPQGQGAGRGVLLSDLWSATRMQPLIRAFLERLVGHVEQMGRMIEAGGGDVALKKLCIEVKGTAAGYGFPQISQCAGEMLQLTMKGAAPAQLKRELDGLAQLCTAACAAVKQETQSLTQIAPADSQAA